MDNCKKQPDIDITASSDGGKNNGLDLIRRQDAIDIASGYCHPANIAKELMKLPSVQPKQKTGEWIFKNDLKQFFCSEYGVPSLTYDDVYLYSMDLPNFCEDCGADMREGGGER